MTSTTCTTCGASFAQGATECTICGTAAVPAGAPVGSGSATGDAHGHSPTGGQQPGASWDAGGGVGPGTTGPGLPPPTPTQQRLDAAGLTSEQRAWAIGAHLGGLGLGLMTAAILGFLAPLTVWLIRKDEDPYADHHAKEALNFQLTVLLAVLLFGLLLIPGIIVGVLTLGVGLVVGAVAVAAATVAWFVLPIIGSIKASNGEGYRYPVTIRFVD